MFQGLVQADPQDSHAKNSLAVSYIHLGDLLGGATSPNLGRVVETMQSYRDAIALLEQAKAIDAANTCTIRDLAEAQRKLAALAGNAQ